jgi:predicted GIY-YIG superfamily endonuclease
MYHVYLLKDRVKHETYIGYLSNLRRRIKEHNLKNPELIYYEAYNSKKDACRREFQLKQRGQTVRRLKERLAHGLN